MQLLRKEDIPSLILLLSAQLKECHQRKLSFRFVENSIINKSEAVQFPSTNLANVWTDEIIDYLDSISDYYS